MDLSKKSTRFCQSVPETDSHFLEELFCKQLPKALDIFFKDVLEIQNHL